MFDKLQEILGRTLNGFETNKLMNWLKENKYTEEEILNAYEYCESKHINYISKYLENNKKDVPDWYNKQINDEPLEPKELIEFQKLMREFYDTDEEWEQRTNELLKESQEYYKKEKIV